MTNRADVMKTVNLYDAKTHLSRLVEQAAAGEEIVIAKGGRPRARLVPFHSHDRPRRPGIWKGQVWIADDFDEPLPVDPQAARSSPMTES